MAFEPGLEGEKEFLTDRDALSEGAGHPRCREKQYVVVPRSFMCHV